VNGRREKEQSKIAWYSGVRLGRSQAVDIIYKYATRDWSGIVSSRVGWLSRKRKIKKGEGEF
jgi:hypothetical protein